MIQSTSAVEIGIIGIIVGGAAYYLWRHFFCRSPKKGCGGGGCGCGK